MIEKFKCGHERTEENTYQYKSGQKRCRICKRALAKKYGHPNRSPLSSKPLLEQLWR